MTITQHRNDESSDQHQIESRPISTSESTQRDNISLVGNSSNKNDIIQFPSKPLLQRRSTTFSTFQATLDGILIIGLIYSLSLLQFGQLQPLYVVFGIIVLATMGIVYDRSGVYRHNGSFTQKSFLLLKAWAITFSILLGLAFLTKTSELYSRQFLIIFFLAGIASQILAHMISRYVLLKFKSDRHIKHTHSNSLIIGTGQLASYLYSIINHNPWIPEKIVGLVDPQLQRPMSSVNYNEFSSSDLPILGNINDVIGLLDYHDIKTVYFAVPLDSSPIIERLYFALLDKNVDIHWAPNIFALNLVNHSVKELAGIPIITLSETPMSGVNLVLKTLEDKILSLFGILIISPVLLLTAIAIKLDDPGPVFFKQDRTGWNGKNFKIWKFRTMHSHQENSEFIQQASKNDPRITRVGKFLRHTSIDELPQLFNVLGGTMSLVGPRPHAVSHNSVYSKKIEAYLARHKIKPGITGLAQVRGYRGETSKVDQMAKRVESDLEYINNWSIWLDFIIVVRTFFVIFHKNAY